MTPLHIVAMTNAIFDFVNCGVMRLTLLPQSWCGAWTVGGVRCLYAGWGLMVCKGFNRENALTAQSLGLL
jgi:hypothetical protein